MTRRSDYLVALGSALAVSGLAGSLLAGGSIRASLRERALRQLGPTTHVIEAPGFAREALSADLEAQPGFADAFGEACPLIALEGFVAGEPGRRRVPVSVFGAADCFWRQAGRDASRIGPDEAYVSEPLAGELGAGEGSTLSVRVARPRRAPLESLFGARDDLSAIVRITVKGTLPPDDLGELSLRPRAAPVRAVFLRLARLQRAVDRARQVNTILIGGRDSQASPERLAAMLRDAVTLDDIGVTVRPLPERHAVAVETRSGFLSESLGADARRAIVDIGAKALPVLSYLVDAIQLNDRRIPYSFVTAMGPSDVPLPRSTAAPGTQDSPLEAEDPAIVLNDWAASRLGARVGDTVWLSYTTWVRPGRLQSDTARFRVSAIVPVDPASADRDLVPRFPGIFAGERMVDWTPTFPIDLARVTPADEDYWRRYQMTPKGFIPIDVGQRMWSSPIGRLTSMRAVDPTRAPDDLAAALARQLRATLSADTMTITVRAARRDALEASNGSPSPTVRVFLYSVLLITAGLVVTAAAAGPDSPCDRQVIAAAAGSAAGSIGAIAYAAFVLHGLRTWWVDSGNAALALHVAVMPLAVGGACGWVLAVAALDLRKNGCQPAPSTTVALLIALTAGPAGLVVMALSLADALPLGAGFVAAGVLCLATALAYLAFALHRCDGRIAGGPGRLGFLRAGFHAAAVDPGRSVLAAALVAFATFVIVAAGAVGPRERSAPVTRRSGAGGFSLVAESVIPVAHDLDTSEGQRAVGFGLPLDLPLSGARFTRFRFRPGDEIGPSSLFRATQPAVLGAPADFVQDARFSFDSTLAEAPDERRNPWLLLEKAWPVDAVPAIADRQSLRALGVSLGGEVPILDGRGRPATLRVVGILADSVLQDAVVIGDGDFSRLFPEAEGFRFFLVDVEPRWAPALSARLDTQLARLGFESTLAADRLASFARAPRASISAFRTLGLVGLIVGVLGAASASLVRARGRTESSSDASLARIAWIVTAGLAAGAAAALIALAPSFFASPFYN